MSAQLSQGNKYKNKVVIVTGGSSGIGRRTAERFAEEGACVAVLASSKLEKAQEVVQGITSKGHIARPYVCDVRDVGNINTMVADVVTTYGTVDVLVNSAGADLASPMGEVNEAAFDRVLETNLKGAFFTINAVTPIMKKAGSGKIINVSAMVADWPITGLSAYCAAKAALNVVTRTMAWELGPHGINCNGVAPGGTLHGPYEAARTEPMFKEYREWVEKLTPTPRDWLTTDDIASPILFLASGEADGICGVTIPVDLGMTAAYDGKPLADVCIPEITMGH